MNQIYGEGSYDHSNVHILSSISAFPPSVASSVFTYLEKPSWLFLLQRSVP